ncbi:hypothetical protein IP68_06035 [Blastomonas sp. AAP25]|nr:hypothetical protein IP68_06035 [Blastomonas sp. AAP25]
MSSRPDPNPAFTRPLPGAISSARAKKPIAACGSPSSKAALPPSISASISAGLSASRCSAFCNSRVPLGCATLSEE